MPPYHFFICKELRDGAKNYVTEERGTGPGEERPGGGRGVDLFEEEARDRDFALDLRGVRDTTEKYDFPADSVLFTALYANSQYYSLLYM